MNPDTLDVKDRRLLLALDMDARKPDSQIAKVIGLSKQVTNYRIRRLEKKGIIRSYYAVIDHTKLGLKLYRFGLKLENADKKKEQEILGYLMKYASWITSTLGQWDIWMAMYAKDEHEFMEFWKRFMDRYGRFISVRWISLMTAFWNFERSFIFTKKKRRERVFVLGGKPIRKKIDKIDRQVLEQLAINARQTSLELAGKIEQTERVVRYRIKRLEKEGVILGYRTFIDTTILGLKYYKLFIELKDARSKDCEHIREHVILDPHVIYSTEALGGYDFELEAHFDDSQELYGFITKVRERFPGKIRDIRHLEYIKEHKVTYFPMK